MSRGYNEIRRLRAALRRIKRVEEDCIKNGYGYNDVIYQVCVKALPQENKE